MSYSLGQTDDMEGEMNCAFMGRTPASLTGGMAVGRGEELGPLAYYRGVSSHVCCFSEIGSGDGKDR